MPSIERARAKHNELVAQLGKLQIKEDKQADTWTRTRAKKAGVIRAIGRSSKRLEKLQAAAIHTNGPTATPVAPLIEEVATKPPAAAKLNDPVPDLCHCIAEDKPHAPHRAQPRRKPKEPSVPIGELHKTPEGKANAETWDAIPAVRRAGKQRRTVDDFKADVAKLKKTKNHPR
jgi:hypothetical protein